MKANKTTKMMNDFRIYFAIFYTIIAFVLLINLAIGIWGVNLESINLTIEFLWSLAFTLLGFSLLVVKICINNIELLVDHKNEEGKDKKQLERLKIKLRYFFFYPILIVAFAVLSTAVSISFFHTEKIQFFLVSTILSFFLGLLIDGIPNIIGKAVDRFSPSK
jgi:cytochrome b561